MNRKITLVVMILALSMIFMSMTFTHTARGEWERLELVASPYTGTNIYAPGETMDIVLHADAGDKYDVFVDLGAQTQPIDENVDMTGVSKKIGYEIDDNTADGNYTIIVTEADGPEVARANFSVQGYSFQIETDREAYLSGDTMKVFWTANNIKDRTLPPTGLGIIRIWNNVSNFPLYQQTFNASSGSVSFLLQPSKVIYDAYYWVEGWFNDTYPLPTRFQKSSTNFSIKYLGAMLDLDKEQYASGSLLKIKILTVVTNNTGNPSALDTPEPETDITISIFDSIRTRLYHIELLKTDSHGIVDHIVYLDPSNYTEGGQYSVEIVAHKWQDRIEEDKTFKISAFSSLAVVLDFDKTQYTSGETLQVNATASSIDGESGLTFTYIIEVRDTAENGTLLLRRTQTTGGFVFDIPREFVEGWLWIRVTIDDGMGNSASVVQEIEVAYAIVLVNVNKDNYLANEELSISYEVFSPLMQNPDTFFVVSDSEGYVINEGTAAGGQFTFNVPSAPSTRYIFTVFASKDGRIVSGFDSAELFSGFVLLIEFDRNNYEPGDIMSIDYNIVTLGDSDLPVTFTITYGLVNGPEASLQTSEASGTLTYMIPDNIDEGKQLFRAYCDFGGDVNEIVTVQKGANPFIYLTIAGIPIFDVLLFLLVLVSIAYAARARRKLNKMHTESIQVKEKTKRVAQDASSGISVECVECGNPIEITTSRRPIEVMCPHCGEIQHIEK